MPVVKVKIEDAEKLPITERYDKGFGSTGMKEKISNFKEMEKEVGEE